MLNQLKKIALFVFAASLISTVSYSQHDHDKVTHESSEKSSDEPKGIKMSDGVLYGKDYDPGMGVIEFSELINNTSTNNEKTILVKGKVAEVCQKMGCWMTMSDGTNTARVKTLHTFFLPKDISGQDAVVIGKFIVTEISEDQARHYNDESKNPTVKSEDIIGPQKVYEIEAEGIKILNSPGPVGE